MVVKIEGISDEDLIRDVKQACYFYALHLLSRQMIRYIVVDIIFKSKMDDIGNCMITYYNDWYKAREFEIQIHKNRSKKTILKTLAHEFVHLKQFAKGELNETTDKWCGSKINTEIVSYHDLPWEVEANCLEPILYTQYMDFITSTK